MARLKVRLRGKTVYDIALADDRAYVAGRKEDCDIVLQPEKGISREHFKLSKINGSWTVEVISRYGEVIKNGEKVQQFSLDHGSAFTVPPYEFDFLMTADVGPIADAPMAGVGMEAGGDLAYPPAVTSAGDYGGDDFGGEEKTVIGVAPTAAYIKIVDSGNEVKEMIRLDAGESWIAGREPSCHIQIRDQRVSRRQFEIRRAGSNFHIIDLGSVNGTLVNGSPISSSDPTAIKSGDAITVLENYLYFELHDSNFQSRLEMVNIAPPSPLLPVSQDILPMEYQQQGSHELMPYQGGMAPMPYQPNYQQGMPHPQMGIPAAASGKFDFQKHRPKILIGAVAVVLLAWLFSGNKNDGAPKPATPTAGPAAPGSPQEAFAKLKPEQQALVRQRYKDAKNLYMAGKYQLAQDEIVKIREMIADYEDLKEIERLSKEAMFIQEQQRRQEEIEKSKAEAEEKIVKQVAECQKKINPSITEGEMDECLSSVMQFNPDHPKINDLKMQVQAIVVQRDAKAAERAVYQGQVAKLKSIYEKAQSVHKTAKNPLDVIASYEKVVGSKLPDPGGLKGQSQRNIAAIRQMMNTKTASYQAEADKLYQSQNLKGAILALRKARQVDPTNDELIPKMERYTSELRKQMMTIYQEGILEESFGNVEGGEAKAGAKDKWKKILDLDIPDGEYYKKAYIKLKKYGAL
ncbi:FHA domain-containing protein [Bdellovibrio svalbardensis]|uniref:FHA domain-containing protein n=1 Tax=Bdellovibrio svalbardensis TaxID=2972972 RepID=A0ABT6DJP6_9BACT|nr:FHA domain-containing protein [Bdellovibrio svalbardensis]MDG0817065.1 FHA domain-containing protein [Bdellovibrio svalbardensis]